MNPTDTNEKDLETLIAGNLVPKADPDDARELLNYRKAFDFVSEPAETRSQRVLSVKFTSGWWKGSGADRRHRAGTGKSRILWSTPQPVKPSTRRPGT